MIRFCVYICTIPNFLWEKRVQMTGFPCFGKYIAVLLILGGFFHASSDVGVTLDAGETPNPHFYNTTNRSWQLGGFRFCTDTFHWSGVAMSGAIMEMNERMANGKIETEAKFSRNTQQSITKLKVITNYSPIAWTWVTNGEAAITDFPSEPYIMLKTGSPGNPDDPEDEDPITVKQIDSLMALPDFYNKDYRWTSIMGLPYYDSLGVNGGQYSGGFMDTYLGETQILIALDSAVFKISNTPVIFDPKGINSSTIYMMSLAMGQEYFHVDLQWQMGFGAKETWAGVSGTNSVYIGTNAEGAFGCFEVEHVTGTDRALAYPKFFPRYAQQLANAPDVSTSGVSSVELMEHYCGAGSTPIDSAGVVNSFVLSAIVQYANYDFFAYAEDICWKEALSECIDPYIGVGAMAPTYNLGINGGGALCAAILSVNNYQSLLNDPLAHEKFPTGNSNYRPNILKVIQNLINAAKKSMTDLSVEIYDEPITKADLFRFFYGDNGTAAKQGSSGLLRHFYLDSMVTIRQDIDKTLNEAFDKLKGKSPSTTGTDNISFRYDFLTILRTVKDKFDTHRDRPNGGDIVLNINKYSKIGGCSANELDNKYPYMEFGASSMNGTDFVQAIDATDNQNIGIVQWTTEFNWSWWKEGVYKSGTNTKRKYDIIVPNSVQGADLWISVTDSSGNTIIRKTQTSGGSNFPTLDSTIIIDTRGNGVGDQIQINLTKSGSGTPDDLADYINLEYSWPTQAVMIKVTTNVTVNGSQLLIDDATLLGGAGLGKVTFDYPSKIGYSNNVLDRIGPALEWDKTTFYMPETQGLPDTLYIEFTEAINNSLSDGKAYLNFKTESGNPIAKTSLEATNITGNKWQFIFPTGTVALYDSVNIVYSSGIIDAIKNKPLKNNWFVPINKIGNTEPRWVIGYIKDTKGDGMGDKITITIKPGTSDSALKPDDCTKIYYSWPQVSNFSEAVIGDAHISVTGNSINIAKQYTSGAGKGQGILDFPPNIFIDGDIIDSVGPALTKAILLEKEKDDDPDSLFLTFTEPITENLVKDHKYLLINDKSVSSIIAIVQDSSATVWLFILKPKTVLENDKVNLVHNSGLIDQAFPKDDKHNPPLPDNQKVTVSVIKSTVKITGGKYLDINADGTMDSITLTLSKSITQKLLDTMSFTFVWPDKNNNLIIIGIPGSDFSFSDNKNIGWKVDIKKYDLKEYATSIDIASNWGNATMTQPNDKTGKMETTSISVDDGIGPVIVNADYFSFNSTTIKDTLIVLFSEKMATVSDNHPFKFWSTSKSDYRIELRDIKTKSNLITFYVENCTDKITPVSGDSLWIHYDHNVKDASGITQVNKNNRKQPLNFNSTYSIVSACYIDNNSISDGYIDIIRVHMDPVPKNMSFKSLANELKLPDYRSFKPISESDITQINIGFEIAVTQDVSRPNTAIDNRDNLIISKSIKLTNDAVLSVTETPILDSLAPVIISGDFKPAHITPKNSGKDVPDTLIVTFSEKTSPITVSTSVWPNPFSYCHKDNKDYKMDLTTLSNNESSKHTFLINNKNDVPKKLDSLWITSNAEVQDANGIIQSKKTVKAPMTIGKFFYDFTTTLFPNPFEPDNIDDNTMSKVYETYSITGDDIHKKMIIMLSPYGFVNEEITITGDATFFDPLGNVLVDKTPLVYNKNLTKQAWYCLWEAVNSNKRKIGSGTYLCIINVTVEKDGEVSDKKRYPVFIGIKRP